MSLPRYATYRRARSVWLGELPTHWGEAPLKVFVDAHRAITYGIVQAGPDTPDGVPYVRPADMSEENGVAEPSTVLRTTLDIANSYQRSTIRSGDLVCSIGPSFGKVMVVPAWLDGGNLTQGTARVAVSGDHNPKYVYWALRATVSTAQWEASIGGATFRALNLEPLARTELAQPPYTEQTAIAAFLDLETAKIDALIAAQERLIALLTEKRQAAISNAVTKGLDPHAPMKDSGVAWLGEVPAHWDVTRLKFVAHVQTGIAKGKDLAGKTTIAVPYLRVANVQDGFLELDDVASLEIEVEQLDRYRLLPGDVLMNEGGDFDKLGRGAIWHGEIPDCIHQNHVFAVRPHGVRAEWLNRITSSQYAQFYFMGRSKQSTNLASISSSNVMELPVLLPPCDEQSAILQFIDDETAKLDRLGSQSQQAVNLLKERRSALIAAAVTGQIDVRGAVAA